jgi:rhodanese-related sulfurtransferase
MGAWTNADLPVTCADAELEPEVSVAEFVEEGGTEAVQVVDVREPNEWRTGHMPRAVLMPLDDLDARCRELDPRRPVVTVCRSGQRSLDAAQQLRAAGFRDARSLAGGMIAWHEAGLPVER